MEPTRHCNQINEDMHKTYFCFGLREILGWPPLFNPSQQPPCHQSEEEEKMIPQVTETTHKDQACSHRRSGSS
jgi:hypothetical protein